MRDCGCTGAAVVAVDEQQHAAWHQLVTEQTGLPWGIRIDAAALQAQRGYAGIGQNDHKTREKNLQTGKSSPGWRREAAR